MTKEEELYRQVKTGKVKLEQLNDAGKAALKGYMDNKAASEEYGSNEQRAGSSKARETAEAQQKLKQDNFNDTVYGGTNKLLSKTKELNTAKKDVPVTAITKIKDQKDNLQRMGLSSTRSAMKETMKPETFGEKVVGTAKAVGRDLKDFERSFYDTLTFGAMDKIDKRMGLADQEEIDRAKRTIAGKAGGLAGYIGPGGAADAAASLLVRPLVKNAPKLVQGITRFGTGGALFQTGLEAGEAISGKNNQSFGERAADIGISTGIGAGLPVVGALAKGTIKKAREVFGGSRASAVDSVVNDVPEATQAFRRTREDVPLNRAPDTRPKPPKNDVEHGESILRSIHEDVDDLLNPPLNDKKALKEWISLYISKIENDNIIFHSSRVKRAKDILSDYSSMTRGELLEQAARYRGVRLESIHKYIEEAKGKLNSDTGDIAPQIRQEAPEYALPIPVRNAAEVPFPRSTKEDGVLNSSPGRDPQPIRLDEDVIKFNESGLGDAGSFGSKISRESTKKKGSISKWWEKTRTQLVDDMAPLGGAEKRITGGVASAEDSLYKSSRMFKGTPERAAQIVQDRLSPIVKGIEKSGRSTDELGKYALAVHARDVNTAGIKSGFTNAEIDDVIARFGTPEMEAARQQLVQVNKDMMKELVDSGVVSRELASVLDDRWKNYIPLFRAFDDESVEIGTGLSNALANVASPIKTLKGSERAVIDPLENMVKNVFQSINSAERNKVASQLHRLNEIDVDDNFIRKLGEGEDVGRKNVVNVKVNGENVKYEVEPEVYKALLNLDKESSNMITNILSKPASLLRAGATLTPEFSLRNPMRDVVQAFVVSKSGFNPITDFGAGLIQTVTKGNLYKDWIDNLGAYGNVMSMDRNVHRQALEKVLKEPVSKKFVNIVTGKSLIRALRYITDTTESATKVGEYRAALRKGVSKEEAAYRSRDIMDFARAGSGVRQANKMVAFLNANIQGKSKLIRAIKENPAGTITRAFTAVTLPTVGIYAMNKQFANDTQRETIDNAPEWMRNSFWLMAIPGTDVVARIPKPFDLAAIFSNLPERALDYAYENDKEAFDGFVSRSLKESALPMQISGLIPFIEGMANYSFFREGDIIPQREQGLEYRDQYDPVRTTETGKFLAKGAEALTGGKGAFKNFSSPRVMDNTIQGLTAGLGKYGTDALDFILKKTGAVDRPVSPTKSIEQKPFAKAFLVDPNQGGKDMDKFYSTLDKLNKEKASNKLNEEEFGKTGKTTDYLPWEKNSLLKKLDATSDEVSGINKEIRSIEKSTLLTADQKRRKIDALLKDRKELVKDSVKLIK